MANRPCDKGEIHGDTSFTTGGPLTYYYKSVANRKNSQTVRPENRRVVLLQKGRVVNSLVFQF